MLPFVALKLCCSALLTENYGSFLPPHYCFSPARHPALSSLSARLHDSFSADVPLAGAARLIAAGGHWGVSVPAAAELFMLQLQRCRRHRHTARPFVPVCSCRIADVQSSRGPAPRRRTATAGCWWLVPVPHEHSAPTLQLY